jgi:uncharacterized integral membrane protein
VTDVKSVVFALCTALCGTAFAYKLRDLKSSQYDPALLALLAAFAFKATAFLIAIPAVAAEVDRWIEIPNIAALGIHIFGGVIFSGYILAALLFWHEPPRKARQKVRWLIIVASTVSLVMIFLWAADGTQDRAMHYLVQNGAHRPLVSIYLLLYITAVLVALSLIAHLCWRRAKETTLPWVRRGLRTATSGALIYTVSPLNRLSIFVAEPLGMDPLKWEILVPISTGTGILLIISGFTMPSWGPRLSNLKSWVNNYRSYRKLYPLWYVLHRSVPEIALHPAAPSRIKNLRYHLYRRIIEIRDARLSLRPYMDVSVAVAAVKKGTEIGLDGDELAAVVEATRLKAALQSRTDGDTPGLDSPGDEFGVRGGDDISSEIAWLLQVAQAYACSPVVAVMDRPAGVGTYSERS